MSDQRLTPSDQLDIQIDHLELALATVRKLRPMIVWSAFNAQEAELLARMLTDGIPWASMHPDPE